jgi:hypothetical protein
MHFRLQPVILKPVGYFSRRREERHAAQAASIASALVQALAETAKSQAQFGQMVGGWIKDLGDLSVKRSAALMGARGGRRTQERIRLRRANLRSGACPLCVDANYTAVTVPMITEHRSHNAVSNGLHSSALPNDSDDSGQPGSTKLRE